MVHPLPEITEALPVQPGAIDATLHPDLVDEKADKPAQEETLKQANVNYDYEDEEDHSLPRTGLRRFLRENPSDEFMREVAIAAHDGLDQAEVKKVERKLFAIIPIMLAVDYAFYYIDKTTLSYAALFGMNKDLNLHGTDYSSLGSIFYVGWLIWALPTNLMMAVFPLSKYTAFNIFLWGVFLMAQAGAKDFGAMLALRLVSGMFEATADPAFLAIVAMWFTRKQQPLVIGYFNIANGIGVSFGGLLGYGIGHINGSLSSWKLEFLIVGALCCGWAIIMGLVIPDAPHQARWLTRREQVIVLARKMDDHVTIEKRRLKAAQLWDSLKDPKTYLFFAYGLFANIPNGGTSNFSTLVVQGFGFNTFETTLLQIPFGVYNSACIGLAIWLNHKTHHLNIRTYIISATLVVVVAGFAMMAFTKPIASRLIGLYMTSSTLAASVLALSLVTGNVGGSTKKLLASASTFLGFAAGNIIGPYAFVTKEAPTYRSGIIVCMVSRVTEIVVILLLRWYFVRQNAYRDKMFAMGHQEYDPSVVTYADISERENKHFRYLA